VKQWQFYAFDLYGGAEIDEIGITVSSDYGERSTLDAAGVHIYRVNHVFKATLVRPVTAAPISTKSASRFRQTMVREECCTPQGFIYIVSMLCLRQPSIPSLATQIDEIGITVSSDYGEKNAVRR